MVRLACVLLTHVSEDDPHQVVLDELSAAFPGPSWALVERVEADRCEAAIRGDVSEDDVRALCAALWGQEATVAIVGAVAGGPRRTQLPCFCASPDDSGSPAVGLATWAPEGGIGPTERELRQLLCLISKYVTSARKVANLKRRVRIDEQTGVLTRGAVLELLNREKARAFRYGRELSVLYVDVDELKTVNDTYGHEAGDELISRVVRTLRSSLRGCDAVGRLGGDEFLVVLPETDAQGARTVMARIRESLTVQRCEFGGAEKAPLASMGYATLGEVDGNQLVAVADARMLRNKRQGRRTRDDRGRASNDFVAA